MGAKMTGAELASMLKSQVGKKDNSNVRVKIMGGVDDESLHLTDEDVKWWRDAKFGMFIHWGVYSVIGHGEWAYFNEKWDENDYKKLAENEFKPNKSADEIMKGWTETVIFPKKQYQPSK